MTPAELLAAIEADSTAKGLAAAGNDSGTAARMAAILPPAVSATYVNERGIFGAFADPMDAEAFMRGLEALAAGDPAATPPVAPNPVVRRALTWMAPNNGGIDVGHPGVRAMIDQMATSGAITAAMAATVKALAERPRPVTADDVSRAMKPARDAAQA